MSYQKPDFRDIKLFNETGDLAIVDGDFVAEKSDQVHVQHILISEKGNWRERPVLGVGLMRFLNATGAKNELKNKVRLQLQYDNMKVQALSISDAGQMDVQAIRLK
jgi:hypothetical protein